MEINYMNQVKENPSINKFVNRGFSLDKINEIETNFNSGREFPKAFREFLFLAGDFNNWGFDSIDGIIKQQEYVKEELEMAGQKVKRPFFAFSVYNSQYSVIFLDEEKEDPDVYLISPFLAEEGVEPLIKPNGWVFSDLVNESIRRVKNNIPF